MRQKWFVFILYFGCLSSVDVLAQDLVLKTNGGIIEGRVIGKDGTGVSIIKKGERDPVFIQDVQVSGVVYGSKGAPKNGVVPVLVQNDVFKNADKSKLSANEGSYQESDTKEILSLLAKGDYSGLEQKVNSFQTAYENNKVTDEDVFRIFYSFYLTSPWLQDKLNEWVNKYPSSYSAHLARGTYYRGLGLVSRGTAYVDDLSGEQIDGMRFFYGKAVFDLSKALELNEKLVPTYCYLIDILGNFSDKTKVQALYKKSLEVVPQNFLVRWYYSMKLAPRWGGSIQEMEAFIEEAKLSYSLNPHLKVLEGILSAEEGDQLLQADQYEDALKAYQTALTYGEVYDYYRSAGKAYFKLGRYQEAVDAETKCLKDRPYSLPALEFRAAAYMGLGNCRAAVDDYEYILSFDPAYNMTQANIGYCYEKLGIKKVQK